MFRFYLKPAATPTKRVKNVTKHEYKSIGRCVTTVAKDHAGLETHVVSARAVADATRSLVHVEERADAMSSAVPVVKPRLPQ